MTLCQSLSAAPKCGSESFISPSCVSPGCSKPTHCRAGASVLVHAVQSSKWILEVLEPRLGQAEPQNCFFLAKVEEKGDSKQPGGASSATPCPHGLGQGT